MTFSANHVDELISASLTGDLTDAERSEMDAHLARCERCRATLAAFKSERRILAALPTTSPPRDLSARVRSGIESGRLGTPWWRRPGGLVGISASAITLAAVLGLVVLNNQPAPVGEASGSPEPTLSLAPSASAVESVVPSAGPSGPPFLAAGQLGYLELSGAPLEPSKLSFINDATGASISVGPVSGPPIAASLSPDGTWLAYITQKGETGANEVWALHLTDGEVVQLGCSAAAPFNERLSWWVQGEFQVLAYTLTSVDLGPASGCAPNDGEPGTTDPWLFDTSRVHPLERIDFNGDTYLGSFLPADTGLSFMVSQAASTPSSDTICWWCDYDPSPLSIGGVFTPNVSPDGNRALFWSGSMTQAADGAWQFSLGGMPQLSGDFRSAGPASPWVGTPLFTDLIPYGGEAFAWGKFTWGPDSDLIAFWDGAWTGVPQSADGKYPSQQDVYAGRVSGGLLSSASRLPLTLDPDAWIVDVKFAPDGLTVAVTIGLPSAGIGDPPSAYLQIVPLDGGAPRTIGRGIEPPPWDGPAVFGR
jgi:hypothetical protein